VSKWINNVTFSNQYVAIKEFHFTYQLALMSDPSIFPTRIDMRRIDMRRIDKHHIDKHRIDMHRVPVLFKDALSSPD
jgi:hypothetical protein